MGLRQVDNIEKLSMLLHRGNNALKNKILFNNLSSCEKRLIADNKKYNQKYKGKKCFVVGNGPSVNNVDFGMLENQLVITVNEMFRHKDFCKLNSNFHFIADPAYLKLNKKNPGDKEIIEKINLLSESNTILFFPIEGVDTVKRYKWQKKLDIQFFASNLYFYDNYKEKIDFTKYIPSFQAVIQWGIAFAVYMGCSEIYLLGCDATNIVTDLSLFINKNADLTYAYDLSKEAAELVRKKHRGPGLEFTLYGYWRIVHLFSELFYYCKRNSVALYNCSEESILDSVPKCRLEDIL